MNLWHLSNDSLIRAGCHGYLGEPIDPAADKLSPELFSIEERHAAAEFRPWVCWLIVRDEVLVFLNFSGMYVYAQSVVLPCVLY